MKRQKIDGLPSGCSVQESFIDGLFYLIFPGPDGTYHSCKFDHRPTAEECLAKLPKKAEVVPEEKESVEPEVKKKVKKERYGEDGND